MLPRNVLERVFNGSETNSRKVFRFMTWNDWINSEESLRVIESCSQYVEKRILRSGFQLLFHELVGFLDDLSSSIWVYVREHADRWEETRPFECIIENGERALIAWICQCFIRNLLDKARSLEFSPARYIYSRIRSVLSSSSEVQTRRLGRTIYYSCDGTIPLEPENICIFREMEFSGWDFLPDISEKNISSAESIVKIARFFWDQVRKHTSRPLWVSLNDLTAYVRSFVHVASFGRVELEDSEWMAIPDTAWEDRIDDIEKALMSASLVELAEKCFATLNDEERLVLLYIHDHGFNLEQTAKALGYAGASSISYIRNRAYRKIREFCIAQPGLSPPDLDSELFEDFMKLLLDLCKKHSPTP